MPEELDESGDKEASRAQRLRNMGVQNFVANARAQQYEEKIEQPSRPGFNQTGRACNVELNAYLVVSQPTKTVFQYDVSQCDSLPSRFQTQNNSPLQSLRKYP